MTFRQGGAQRTPVLVQNVIQKSFSERVAVQISSRDHRNYLIM
jgi:hypothetical protein